MCNLKKALYGLKQSGCEWYSKLDHCLTVMAFAQLGQDMAMYKMGLVVVAVYVDDLIIVGIDSDVDHMITTICAQFKITGSDDAEWCLSVHIQQLQDCTTVLLGQMSYIDTILECFSMTRANPVKTPLDPSAVNLSPKDASHKTLNKAQMMIYQQMIGSVMYLMTSTHLYLAFMVGNLAKHLSLSTMVHLNQACHLLHYISYMCNSRLMYLVDNNSRVLLTYADADHAGSWMENLYSMSGFVLMLFGGAVAWRSCQQRIILTLTAEAEVVALSNACHDIDWIINIIKGLDLVVNSNAGVVLHTDNQAGQQVTSLDGLQQNKALTLCVAYIKDAVEKGLIIIKWIPGKLQIVDGLTKLLNARGSNKSHKDLGVLAK